jgi:hypothetical protein
MQDQGNPLLTAALCVSTIEVPEPVLRPVGLETSRPPAPVVVYVAVRSGDDPGPASVELEGAAVGRVELEPPTRIRLI